MSGSVYLKCSSEPRSRRKKLQRPPQRNHPGLNNTIASISVDASWMISQIEVWIRKQTTSRDCGLAYFPIETRPPFQWSPGFYSNFICFSLEVSRNLKRCSEGPCWPLNKQNHFHSGAESLVAKNRLVTSSMFEMIRKTYGRARRGFSRKPEVEKTQSDEIGRPVTSVPE